MNTTNLIMQNLFESGLIILDDEGEEIFIFKSFRNDYIIEMQRKKVKVWNEENSYKYLCKLTFKNNLNITVYELIVTEEDIYKIIDSSYAYVEYCAPTEFSNLNDISTFISSNSSMVDYIVTFKRELFDTHDCNDYQIYTKQFFVITEKNKINNNMMQRICIEFNDVKIEEFLNMLYLTFLVDVRKEEYMLLNDYTL